MPKLSLSLGILLIIIGLASYFGTGQESITALIPSFFGLLFVVFGALARKENLRKHMMHASAGLALLGLLGTARGIPGIIEILGGGSVERPMAVYAQTAMFLMCLAFLVRAVGSFIQARKEQE